MGFLMTSGLAEEVEEFAASGDRPLLGICLGMQMMATTGFEGGTVRGLNLIGGVVEPIPRTDEEGWDKTPRIGWLEVEPRPSNRPMSSLLGGAEGDAKFYFAHGFHFVPDDPSVVRAVVLGDPVQVVAAVQCGNLYGTQFHPEKSGELGLALLRRFVAGFSGQGDGA
jgi:glutamine amidotransferase